MILYPAIRMVTITVGSRASGGMSYFADSIAFSVACTTGVAEVRRLPATEAGEAGAPPLTAHAVKCIQAAGELPYMAILGRFTMLRFVARTLVWVVVCCLLSTSIAFAQSFTVRPIKNSLHVLTRSTENLANMMNNLVSVGRDGVLLIDTTDAGAYATFRAGMDQVSVEPVKVLVNTHWHHDHTGLNADFVVTEHTGTILAHWRTGSKLSSEQHLLDFDASMPALPAEAQPTDPVYWGKLLHHNGENIALIPALPNAHSGTDLLVFCLNSNVVYMGDIYFGGLFPFIDRASGGTLAGMIGTSRLVHSMINEHTVVIPSHGPVGNRSTLANYVAMLEVVGQRVHALIEQGMSEEDVLSAKPLADLDAQWSWFLLNGDTFARLVYRDLTHDLSH